MSRHWFWETCIHFTSTPVNLMQSREIHVANQSILWQWHPSKPPWFTHLLTCNKSISFFKPHARPRFRTFSSQAVSSYWYAPPQDFISSGICSNLPQISPYVQTSCRHLRSTRISVNTSLSKLGSCRAERKDAIQFALNILWLRLPLHKSNDPILLPPFQKITIVPISAFELPMQSCIEEVR